MPDGAPLVVAHRGASATHPENTVAAFRGAAEQRADWVELDVRRTADRALVVHHDAWLPGGDAVVERARATLPPSVCTLAEALEACAGLGVNIEIKSTRDEPDFDPGYAVCEATVALLHETGFGPVLVTSFDLGAIDRVHALDPSVPTGLLSFAIEDADRLFGIVVDRGHVALNPWNGITTPDLVAAAHAAGLGVNVWTVDDVPRIQELAAMEVDGVITNAPDVARFALGRT